MNSSRGEQNVFCYLDFCSYLKVNYPKSLPFVLKKVLFSKFIAKSTYRLLKWPQKIKPIEI